MIEKSISYRSSFYYLYFYFLPNSYGRMSDHGGLIQILFKKFAFDHNPIETFMTPVLKNAMRDLIREHQTGRFHLYWKPRIKGICHSFEIPARFEICIYKPEKRCLYLHIPKRKNPHSRSSVNERKDCRDFQCRIHENGRYSYVTYRCGATIFRTLTRVLVGTITLVLPTELIRMCRR